jgi:GTP-binding protein
MIATFVKSSAKLDQLPAATKPEFAFIGRSNVGKSSLINMLTSKKELAKTSGNPGKTQTINHFIIDENWIRFCTRFTNYSRRMV